MSNPMTPPTDPTPENPPAFPCNWMDFQPGSGEQVVREQYFGLTVHDYFAAKFTAAWITALAMRYGTNGYTDESAAMEACRLGSMQADAMLRARKEAK